jgi:hypothetical protein
MAAAFPNGFRAAAAGSAAVVVVPPSKEELCNKSPSDM